MPCTLMSLSIVTRSPSFLREIINKVTRKIRNTGRPILFTLRLNFHRNITTAAASVAFRNPSIYSGLINVQTGLTSLSKRGARFIYFVAHQFTVHGVTNE